MKKYILKFVCDDCNAVVLVSHNKTINPRPEKFICLTAQCEGMVTFKEFKEIERNDD